MHIFYALFSLFSYLHINDNNSNIIYAPCPFRLLVIILIIFFLPQAQFVCVMSGLESLFCIFFIQPIIKCTLLWKLQVHECTFTVKDFIYTSMHRRSALPTFPTPPDWTSRGDARLRRVSLLILIPTTTTTNLIRLDSCKPFFHNVE